ncbi:LEA type 2 family protein [Bacteroidales bacterium AH-315-I05]|nr:LEA type 2 family protein [Bacteroidales bacterium AH-315-I05]
MRMAIIITIIVAMLLIFGAIQTKALANRIDTSVQFKGVDLTTIKLKDITKGFAVVRLKLEPVIYNQNNIAIPVSGLFVEIYYQGQKIGQSVQPVKFRIQPKGITKFDKEIDIKIDKEIFPLLDELKSGKYPQLDYRIRLKIFGLLPYSFEDKITILEPKTTA